MLLFAAEVAYCIRRNEQINVPFPLSYDAHWFQIYLLENLFLNFWCPKLKEFQEKIQPIFIFDSCALLHYSCRLTALRFFDIRKEENLGAQKASSERLPN
jgi:hypothetical protein